METKSPITLTQAVAERIRELLAKNNMTQYKFEQVSGIAHGHLGHILYGRKVEGKQTHSKSISFMTVALIAKGFNLSLAEFLDSPLFSYDRLDVD